MGGVHDVFASHGLKQWGGRILVLLAERDSFTQHGLAEALRCDPGTLVGALNELESMQCIERRRDPDDRRRHIVALLPAGREAFQRIASDLEAFGDQFFSALTQAKKSTLNTLLAELAADVLCLPPKS